MRNYKISAIIKPPFQLLYYLIPMCSHKGYQQIFNENYMTRRLYRSQKDKIIAGVCAGLAEYFEIDATLVRLIFVIVVLAGGAGILAYIILWIVVPQNLGEGVEIKAGSKQAVNQFAKEIKDKANEVASAFKNETKTEAESDELKKRRSFIPALILIGLGLVFLFGNFFPWFAWHNLWPLILIVIGLAMIVNPRRK